MAFLSRAFIQLSVSAVLVVLVGCFGSDDGGGGVKIKPPPLPLRLVDLASINAGNTDVFSFGGECIGEDLWVSYSLTGEKPPTETPGQEGLQPQPPADDAQGGVPQDTADTDDGTPAEEEPEEVAEDLSLTLSGRVQCLGGFWESDDINLSQFVDGDLALEVTIGSFTFTSTILKDIVAPTFVTVNAVADILGDEDLTLTGTCDGDGHVEVTVGSFYEGTASCEDNLWQHVVAFGEEQVSGPYAVSVTFEDLAGNVVTAQSNPGVLTTTVTRDITPPALTFQEFTAINDVSPSPAGVILRGDCENNVALVLTINDEVDDSPPTCNGGTWTRAQDFSDDTAYPEEEEVTITVAQTDMAGNVTEHSQTVIKDTDPATLDDVKIPRAATYDSGAVLQFVLEFSEPVTVGSTVPHLTVTLANGAKNAVYREGDGTDKLVFAYTVVTGDADLNDDGIVLGPSLSGGTVHDLAGNPVTVTIAEDTSEVLVNATSIIIRTVSANPTGPRAGGPDVVVNLAVFFSGAVTVTGTPELELDIGGEKERAEYVNGAGVNHVFAYTVGIDLNSEQVQVVGIKKPSGATLEGVGNGGTAVEVLDRDFSVTVNGLEVDNTPPGITGVADDEQPTKVKSWTWDCDDTPCTFRFAVSDQEEHDFVDEATSPYQIVRAAETVADANGTYYLHVQAKDLAGNESEVTSFSALIDNTGPVLSGELELPAAKTYKIGDYVDFVVRFDEAVSVSSSGVPRLELTVGDASVFATYTAITDGDEDALVFRYTVQEDDVDSDGVAITSTGIDLQGATLQDALENIATATSITIPTTGLDEIFVDGVRPRFTGVSAESGFYRAGETIEFIATFDEEVQVLGTPRIQVAVGSETVYANFLTGSGLSNEHSFSFDVSSEQNDDDGVQILVDLDRNGKRVRIIDANGNDAVLTLDALVALADVQVDNTDPTLVAPVTFGGNLVWSCSDASQPCTYRHLLNEVETHTFESAESYDEIASIESPTDLADVDVSYYLHIQALDGAGNESDVLSTLIVEKPSAVAITSMGNINIANHQSYSVSGTCTHDGLAVTLVLTDSADSTLEGSAICGESQTGEWATSFDTSTSDIVDRAITVEADHGGAMGSLATNRDTVVPTINTTNTIGVPTNDTYNTGEALQFVVTFSESVVVSSGSPRLHIEVGNYTRYATYSSGSGSSTLTFSYTVQTADSDADGVSVAYNNKIELVQGAGIADGVGNPFDAASQVFTVPVLTQVKVDALDVRLIGVASQGVTSAQKVGGAVVLVATFNKQVTMSATRLNLHVDTITAQALLTSDGAASTTHEFTYTVMGGQNAAAGEVKVKAIDTATAGASLAAVNGNAVIATGYDYAVAGLVVDTTAPTYSSSVATAAGTYFTNDTLNVDVTFSEVVAVTGTPQVPVVIGSNPRNFTYSTGSGTNTLRFAYTLTDSDTDTDGLALGSPARISGGTVADTAGNAFDYTGTLSAPGTLASINVGNTLGLDAHGAYINGANKTAYPLAGDCNGNGRDVVAVLTDNANATVSRTYTCTSNRWSASFDTTTLAESTITIAVTHGNAISPSGKEATKDTVAPSVTGLANDSTPTRSKTWTWLCNQAPCSFDHVVDSSAATVPSGAFGQPGQDKTKTHNMGTGTFYIHVRAKDAAGNISTAAHASAILDNTGPAITVATAPTAPTNGFGIGGTVVFSIDFDEDVTVASATPAVKFTTDDGVKEAAYSSSDSTNRRLVFNYVVEENVDSLAGIWVDANSPFDNHSATIRDALGNDAVISDLEFAGATYSAAPSPATGIIIDGTRPIQSTTVAMTIPADDTYEATDVWAFGVTFSENVVVSSGGAPALALRIGLSSSDVAATYSSSDSTVSKLVFNYTVQTADEGALSTITTSINLNSATIKDAAGNDIAADLSLTVPATLSGIIADGDGSGNKSLLKSLLAERGEQPALFDLAGDHACGVAEDGEEDRVQCWTLGDGARADGVQLAGVSQVSVGAASTCVVLESGQVACWESMDSIRTVLNEEGVQVSVGAGESCALKTDGSVWCWSGSHLQPESIASDLIFVHLSAGSEQSCAVSSDGDVWCWADGTLYQQITVSGAHSVAVGTGQVCALLEGGVVSCWSGEADPAPVPGLTAVAQVDLEGERACARLKRGGVSCWNANGLPAGTKAPSDTYHIAVGGTESCALSLGDGLVCWKHQ